MAQNGSSADLIFTSGAVYTVDAARTWAQAVAVKDGRIVAVGTDDEIGDLRGSHTEVVDLKGRMLLPGFQDSHVHPVAGGQDMLQCELHDAHDLDEYLRIIRAYADDHPDREWILGGGWAMDIFPGGAPGKDLLDKIVPDRFVYLPSRDGHSAWVNSRTLERAGITAETPDPADGRIERDSGGEPSGTLQEGAMEIVGELTPPAGPDELMAGLLKGQEYMHSLGITAWQDAIVGTFSWSNSLPVYMKAAAEGTLTARVIGALWWDRNLGLEQIPNLKDMRDQGRAGRFEATSIKIMQDGVLENYTAATLSPYLDPHGHETDNSGISFVEPGLLKEAVTRLDADGFQVHFHSLAARAVREALDAIEAAREANGPNDLRHHLAHIQIVHPEDLPRFRRLNAVANCQPLWAINEGQMVELTIPFIGPERAAWQYPFQSLKRHGAVLAFGSDWPVSTPNPIEEMHVAVNRQAPANYAYADPDIPNDVFIPQERVDLPTALAAFTIGTAYVNHLDADTGSIEPGKYADLAVLDRNLFEHPVAEIAEAKVQGTWLEGELVSSSDAL